MSESKKPPKLVLPKHKPKVNSPEPYLKGTNLPTEEVPAHEPKIEKGQVYKSPTEGEEYEVVGDIVGEGPAALIQVKSLRSGAIRSFKVEELSGKTPRVRQGGEPAYWTRVK